VKKTIIFYGLALAALLFLMQWLEYGFIVRDLSLEFYLGVVAVVFAAIGIWAGQRLTRSKTKVIIQTNFSFNDAECSRLGISKRELEVLQLMSEGFSNQEIADKLFVSLNTIKTHTSNLFLKLEVKRRTQAIQRSKELMIIP
jgi:NarL family two-component system response regulator LiaR